MAVQSHIRWFSEIGLEDIPEVGGKTASLGELYSVLGQQGVRVPQGFALTAAAYREALDAVGAWNELRGLMEFDPQDVALLLLRFDLAQRTRAPMAARAR
jgi:pyruvate,water dikinase